LPGVNETKSRGEGNASGFCFIYSPTGGGRALFAPPFVIAKPRGSSHTHKVCSGPATPRFLGIHQKSSRPEPDPCRDREWTLLGATGFSLGRHSGGCRNPFYCLSIVRDRISQSTGLIRLLVLGYSTGTKAMTTTKIRFV